jgi:hypothetical protein
VAYLRRWLPSFRTLSDKREIFPILFDYDNLEIDRKNEITDKLIDFYLDGGGALTFWRRAAMSEVRSKCFNKID